MNWYTLWTTAGWAVFILVIFCSLGLAFALIMDTRKRKGRNIAAPDLSALNQAPELEIVEDRKETKAPILSRKARRMSGRTSAVKVEDASESSLWSDSDDFDFSAGRD